MNFKNWLLISEKNVKNTPSSGSAIDTSSLYGAAAQWGGSHTQLPGEKAATHLGTGVGLGVDAELQKQGRVFNAQGTIVDRPGIKDMLVMHGELPIQINKESKFYNKEGQPMCQCKGQKETWTYILDHLGVKDPMNHDMVLRPGNEYRKGETFIPLYDSDEKIDEADSCVQCAKNFTKTLIHIVIVNEIVRKGDKDKYDLLNPEFQKEIERDGRLLCVLSFKKSDKKTADEVGGQT